MADDGTFTLKDAQSAINLQKGMRYLAGMMRAKIPGGSNGPRGPVFPQVAAERGEPNMRFPGAVVRVDSTVGGQGAYRGFVQKLNTNAASLTVTNNVSLASMLSDDEEVVFFNTAETAKSFTSPAGTVRTHFISIPSAATAAAFVPAFATGLAVASGSNQRRVFENYIPPRMAAPVKITGTLTGGGYYKGFIQKATGDLSGGSTVSSGDVINDGPEIIIRNDNETSTHVLSGSTVTYPAAYLSTNTDGKQVWVICADAYEACPA